MEKDKCHVCGEPIEGQWNSLIELGIETGELKRGQINRLFFHDKCIKCSPSRSQHIVHPRFPPVRDDREQYNKEFWDKYERAKYQKLYTNAWILLQEKFNPTWACQK